MKKFEYNYEDKPGRLSSMSFASYESVEFYLSEWSYLPMIYRREVGSRRWVPENEWGTPLSLLRFKEKVFSFFRKNSWRRP